MHALVIDLDDTDPTPGVELLEANGFTVTVITGGNRAEALAMADTIDALLVGLAPIDAEFIGAFPRLKIIALISRGTNHVDVDAATARGIWVSSLPDIASTEVAEHGWALTLAALRRLKEFDAITASGGWIERSRHYPRRVSELTLGLAGLGRIGLKVAALAQPAVAEIIGFDERYDPSRGPDYVTAVSKRELFERADAIVVTLPATAATHHFVDAEALALLPSGSVLVNVARGALVDAKAVAAALDSGILAGAGIDVFDPEPPAPDDPLINHPLVLATPHIAYMSAYSEWAYAHTQAANVVAALTDGAPLHPVNQIETVFQVDTASQIETGTQS